MFIVNWQTAVTHSKFRVFIRIYLVRHAQVIIEPLVFQSFKIKNEFFRRDVIVNLVE